MEENKKVNNKAEVTNYIEEIENEAVPFNTGKTERTLVTTKKGNVRKRNDGYYNVNVPTRSGNGRMAIVPRDTLERLIKEKTSFRPLKDRYNTLSALTLTFDKPLMYYAIVAYDKVPKEDTDTWTTSEPLLKYEMIHLNGNLDDIREENIRITFRDTALWKQISDDYKSQNKIGADVEYARRREENFKKQYKDFPDLKLMVRVIDPVKKHTKAVEKQYDSNKSW